MLKDIVNKENLIACSYLLKRKRFVPGFDGMSMEGVNSWLHINGDRLCRDVLKGEYSPMPAMGFRTAKQNGGYRNLNRLTALDTVLQNALLKELQPLSETFFSESSFAYRPGRGVTAAVERYVQLANRHPYAARIDFRACFDHVDHTLLRETMETYFEDPVVCEATLNLIKCPVYVDGEILPTEKGLLQGMPLAPLLCNLYFHPADLYLEEKEIPFIRYADDLVIFGDSAEEMLRLEKETLSFLEEKLLLKRNSEKLKMVSSAKMEFLGHRFASDKKGITAVSGQQERGIPYSSWQNHRPLNNRRRVELISDGILRQKGFSLLFDTDVEDSQLPVAALDVINVYSNVIFDSGALQTALKNGVTVNLFDREGERIGSFEPNTKLKAPKLNHEQLLAYYNERKRLKMAKEFVLASLHNTNLVIRYYQKQQAKPIYATALEILAKMKKEIKEADSIERLMLLEANVRKAYYGCFDSFLERSGFSFEKRTRRPPRNEVNALLSFGNAVLYNSIATEIEKTPLDIRIGFLHATTDRKKTLNLDLAEIFKPLVVDRTVFTLINKKEIEKKHFDRSEQGGVFLTAEGKRVFLRAFYKKLEVELDVKGVSKSYRQIIVDQIRGLVRHFRHGEIYKAYRQVR